MARGGTIFMAAILKAYNENERKVWVADSFQGLPKPNELMYPADKGNKIHSHLQLAVSLDEVKTNFLRYGLLDERIRFLPGWFKDTLPAAPIVRLAVARIDGDLYESSLQALEHLYPKLSTGGYVIIDDYGNPRLRCRQAVDDFRRNLGIEDEISSVDESCVFWRKTTGRDSHPYDAHSY
jgi:hypothetical protein